MVRIKDRYHHWPFLFGKINFVGYRPTSITTRLPLYKTIVWWEAGRRSRRSHG